MMNGHELQSIQRQPGRLRYDFVPGQKIGEGGFGYVIKAQHKIDGKTYAIKSIVIYDIQDYNDKIKELVIWAKLDCDFFVQYRSSWVETDVDKDLDYLHIQVDLCDFALDKAIAKIYDHFHPKTHDLLPELGHFVASQLLLELLESVHYLHTLDPKIIHRDIKPGNILIKYDRRNARFVKLGDFGLSVVHEITNQSHTKRSGTDRYMAPEVKYGHKYNTTADVYSIGILNQELFNFDINKDDSKVPEKYRFLIRLTRTILKTSNKGRPSCQDMIDDKNKWCKTLKEIESSLLCDLDLDKQYSIDKDFVRFFLMAKLKYYQQSSLY